MASLWLGALLAPAALLLTHAWPRLAARERHAIWWVVLLAIVLAPLVTEGRKDGTTEERTEGGNDGTTERPSVAVPSVIPSFRHSVPEHDAGPPASQVASWSLAVPVEAPRVLTLVWALGALLGLLALVRELASLSRIRRAAEPPGAGLLSLWRQAIASLPTRRVLRLLVTDQVDLPAACGYSRPAVLVPRHFELALDDDEMRHLLLHELAHLARRDDWSLALERLIRVFWWWHPVVWWIGPPARLGTGDGL